MGNIFIKAESYNPQVLYVINVKHNKATKTEYHCHDFLELSIVLSGSVEYIIENKSYMVNEREILVFNPGVYHKEILNSGCNVNELHIGITNIKLDSFNIDSILPAGMSSIVKLNNHTDEFFKCCEDILREQQNNNCWYDLVLKSYIMKLVVLILRVNSEIEISKDTSAFTFVSLEKKNIVNSILNYINENYMNNISLDKLSKNMYLSPVYISKIFKEETGDSPINYLIKVRLAKAKELLEKHEMPIKLIAKAVGYNDAYYFSKLFKKYYGYPPSKN